MKELEDGNFLYRERGLLNKKATEKKSLNEGLCDFIGSVVGDRAWEILKKEFKLAEQNPGQIVGYPDYFWPIKNFYDVLSPDLQIEFVKCIILAKQKYNSVQPIRHFLRQIITNKQNPYYTYFKNITTANLFYLTIFDMAKHYLEFEKAKPHP